MANTNNSTSTVVVITNNSTKVAVGAEQGPPGVVALTTNGNSGPASFSNSVLNIPTPTLAGLGAQEALGYIPVPLTSGNVVNGIWYPVPTIFRLNMSGTGILTMDSKDTLGNISRSVYKTALDMAHNQIGYPYAGAGAVAVRFNTSSTTTVQVIA